VFKVCTIQHGENINLTKYDTTALKNIYFDTKYLNKEFVVSEMKFDKRHINYGHYYIML